MRAIRRPFVAAGVAAAVVTAVFAAWITLHIGGAPATDRFDNLVQLGAAMFAAAMCGFAARRRAGRDRRAWAWLAAAQASWAIGQGIWTYYEVFTHWQVPTPSWADAGYLLWSPLAVVGVMLLPAAPDATQRRLRTVVDAVVVAGSVFSVGWILQIDNVVHQSADSMAAKVISTSYPVLDVIVFAALVFVLARARRGHAPLALLLSGVAAIAVADAFYVDGTLRGWYQTGNALDLGWVVGFLLVGLAALRPERAESGFEAIGPQSRVQAALPYSAALLAVAIGSMLQLRHREIDPVLYWDVITIVMLVLARQMLSLAERTSLERRLVEQALHDPLCGLANRTLLHDRAQLAFARARRNGSGVALLLLDLDDFKMVNDTLGHHAGDELLCTVGDRLRSCVRECDTVARLGGDEFAVLIEERDALDIALQVSRRLLSVLRQPTMIRGRELLQRASVGIAVARSSDEDLEVLLANADIAMYAAKADGKGAVRVFSHDMLARVRAGATLVDELRHALASDQLVLHFQPIVSSGSGLAEGVEALVRWRHPDRGLLQPGEFVPCAEQSGLIIAIGRWVVNEALRQAARWCHELGDERAPWVSVNVSPRQLLHPGFVDEVFGALRVTRVPAEKLVLEITETTLVENLDAATRCLEDLRAQGVRVAIDDFGSGYSSMRYLQRLPTDYLKIDKAFVTALGRRDVDDALIETIIGMADRVGLRTIAEGVENEVQRNLLRSLACDDLQGFLIACPLDGDDLVGWLRDQATAPAPPGDAVTAVSHHRLSHDR